MWSWEDLRVRPEVGQLDTATRRVIGLAEAAGLDFGRRPLLRDAGFVDRLRSRIGAPATLTVIGQVGAGKSSFVNSLVGRRLLPASGSPTDGVISVLLYAPSYDDERAERVDRDGTVVAFDSVEDGLRFVDRAHTRETLQDRCREVRFYLHDPLLRSLRVVNTPGLGDRREQFERVTLDYLREDESDLIAWIFFPDAAANHDEIRTFAGALERRRDAVLGVVSRCLDGYEDEPDYDPRQDPDLADVAAQLRAELGDYLNDLVLYDSRVAQNLIGRLRAQPELISDDTFAGELDRCGYRQVERAVEEAALRPGAQVGSLLKRCAETTRSLSGAVDDAEQVFTDRTARFGAMTEAWLVLNRDVLEPARAELRTALSPVADSYAGELADTIGQVTEDVLVDGFTLGKVLGNKTFGRLTGKGPLAEQLTELIEERVQATLAARNFDHRLQSDFQRALEAQLLDLQLRLNRQVEAGPQRQQNRAYDVGRPAAGADAVLDKVLAPALGRALTGLITGLAKKVAKAGGKAMAKPAAEAVKTASGAAATGAAVKATADQAAKTGLRGLVSGPGATVLAVVNLAIVPLDIKKIIAEFNDGKTALMGSARTKVSAERSNYARQIEAQFAEAVDEVWAGLRQSVGEALGPDDRAAAEVSARLAEVQELRADLAALRTTFERAGQ